MTNLQANVTEFYGQEEAEQLDNYIKTYYSTKVPPPERPTKEDLSFWKLAGFETISFFIPSISFATFSALRTSGFFLIEQLALYAIYEKQFGFPRELSWLLSAIVMIASILGFEGYMLARGIKAGRSQNENHVSKTGTFLTFIVIILAGIYTGIGLITIPDNVKVWIDVGMALITGISGGVITFYGGNDIGYAIKRFEVAKDKIVGEFQSKYNDWYDSAVQSYITAKRQVAKVSGVSNKQQDQQPKEEKEDQKKLSKFEIAYNFIVGYYSQYENIPTNKIVSDTAGVALGTAFSAIQKFVIDNAQTLLNAGKITQKVLEDTNKKYYGNIIKDFVKRNNRFLSIEEVGQLGIPPKELARFIVDNRDWIVENNMVDEQTIQEAEQVMSGEGA